MKNILGYMAMGAGTIAAVMVSANLSARLTGYGFVIFTASSVTWIAYALQDGETPLILQNAALTLINLVGIYRWLIVRK
ncbi:MAG: hypothetical protein ACK4M6_05970 [Hyphomonas sp.]